MSKFNNVFNYFERRNISLRENYLINIHSFSGRNKIKNSNIDVKKILYRLANHYLKNKEKKMNTFSFYLSVEEGIFLEENYLKNKLGNISIINLDFLDMNLTIRKENYIYYYENVYSGYAIITEDDEDMSYYKKILSLQESDLIKETLSINEEETTAKKRRRI